MRATTALALSCLFAPWVQAAAPLAKESPEALRQIRQLGDETTAKQAAKAREALGEADLPAHYAVDRHAADVWLRARVTASAIEKQEDREVRKPVGHKAGVLAVAVSPDGKRAASAGPRRGEGVYSLALWQEQVRNGGGLVADFPGRTVVEGTFQLPGYFKRVARMKPIMGDEIVLRWENNDGKLWTKQDDDETKKKSEWNPGAVRTEHCNIESINFLPMLEDADRQERLSLEGEDWPADVVGVGVWAHLEGAAPVALSSGARVGLLLKVNRPSAQGKGTNQVLHAGYKTFDGGPVALPTSIKEGGKILLDISYHKVEFRDSFAPSDFAKPSP